MNFVKQNISTAKVVAFVATALVSAGFAWVFQPSYHDNANAVLVITTAFSVLAGFLITVLAITADERSLRGTNWRQDVVYFVLIKRDLRRHRNMFYLYLAVLALALIGAMDIRWPTHWQVILERILLFLAGLALLWSFRLPNYLMRRHLDALDHHIKERRDQETGK